MSFQSYSSDQIKRVVIQVLESIHLIENSKKSEIVIGRFNFFMQTVSFLENNKEDSRYIADVQEGLILFKSAYPDKTPSEIALAILEQPNIIFYNELYCISLYNFLGRQFKDYVGSLKIIKNESAKNKRKEKLLESLEHVKKEIEISCQDAKSFQKIFAATENLENIIRSRSSFDDLNITEE